MANSKKNVESDEQTKMFIDAARALGCDEDPAHFDATLKKVARHKPQADPGPQTKEPKRKKPGQ